MWIMDYGMRGILMSSFTDFIAFKSSLFKCKRNIFFCLRSIRRVFILSGIDKLNIQSKYRRNW